MKINSFEIGDFVVCIRGGIKIQNGNVYEISQILEHNRLSLIGLSGGFHRSRFELYDINEWEDITDKFEI